MLEQQNIALSKQYFIISKENDALKTENSRHCSQLQDLQNDCLAYQSILQMLHTRLKALLQLYNKPDVLSLTMLTCRFLPKPTRSWMFLVRDSYRTNRSKVS